MALNQTPNDYYVYVYIDPRNFTEFYYGKGKGSRKDAHLDDESGSDKARQIATIKKACLTPIIRVVARGLSEREALLVEKTLLWRLGRQLTNVAPGAYAEHFRPQNTLHTTLTGFDYRSGVYYYNIGEGINRNWDDYVKYGFISAGQGPRWRDAMRHFKEGDIVAAFLKGKGYVGIGQITAEARPIREVIFNGQPLLSLPHKAPLIADNVGSDDFCEYVARVNWIKAVDRTEAKWASKAGLYTTTHVRASLEGQPETLKYLEDAFSVSISALIE